MHYWSAIWKRWLGEGTESLLKEIVTKNFLNLRREMGIQIHEAQMFPYRIHAKNSVLRHIIIKLSKVKDKQF